MPQTHQTHTPPAKVLDNIGTEEDDDKRRRTDQRRIVAHEDLCVCVCVCACVCEERVGLREWDSA